MMDRSRRAQQRLAIKVLERAQDTIEMVPPDSRRYAVSGLQDWCRQFLDDRAPVIERQRVAAVADDAAGLERGMVAAPAGRP
jgi:hypothetical protein